MAGVTVHLHSVYIIYNKPGLCFVYQDFIVLNNRVLGE